MKVAIENTVNDWQLYTLTNDQQMSVSLLNYGGIITSIRVPNRHHKLENIVLAFKNLENYTHNPNFLGATVGRVAGRVQGASFQMNNETYVLEQNEKPNHLHGGTTGFHQVIWATTPFQTEDSVGVTLTHTSLDGEGGYPGTVEIEMTYTLTNQNEFIIAYTATSNRTTALTMTNHSYFNLSGNMAQTIQDHHITMASDQFVELDHALIPTGRLLDVTNTPFDFQQGRVISDGIQSSHPQNVLAGNGYDHYFMFSDEQREVIRVKENTSGRTMSIETNQPGVVIYTANGLTEELDLAEGLSKRYSGICFETQASPASLHHDGFPTVLLEAHVPYEKQTRFSFNVEE